MTKISLAILLAAFPTLAFAAPALNIDSVAGVYKYDFPNALMDGTKYNSENILEIVKVSSDTAYLRTHLEFANGHQCNLAVLAHVDDDALLWRGTNILKQPCELRLYFAGGKASFDDKNDYCRVDSCGARGEYNGVSFDAKSRRPIGYMKRLLASSEYADALKAAGK